MLTNLFIAVSAILLMMLGWAGVQQLARLYAARHPEFGPASEEGGGCGNRCGCHGGGSCQNKAKE